MKKPQNSGLNADKKPVLQKLHPLATGEQAMLKCIFPVPQQSAKPCIYAALQALMDMRSDAALLHMSQRQPSHAGRTTHRPLKQPERLAQPTDAPKQAKCQGLAVSPASTRLAKSGAY